MEVTKITSAGVFHFTTLEIDYQACWHYIGPAYWDTGYPIINRRGKNWIASRFVWFALTGRDRKRVDVHHTCFSRNCVNPFHLEEQNALRHRSWHSKRRVA